jgi:deazaflavin-dependent oxidoreductase (nitroreductase family)
MLELADRSWPVLRRLMGGHAAIYRATGGLIGDLPGLPPRLLLDHMGARSGKRRTTPLVYMPWGEDLVVVPSKGGHPRNPGWFHNLRAHAETTVQIGRRRIPVLAREATAEERRRLWPRAVEHNPAWGRYQKRTSRRIPLVILERATSRPTPR